MFPVLLSNTEYRSIPSEKEELSCSDDKLVSDATVTLCDLARVIVQWFNKRTSTIHRSLVANVVGAFGSLRETIDHVDAISITNYPGHSECVAYGDCNDWQGLPLSSVPDVISNPSLLSSLLIPFCKMPS